MIRFTAAAVLAAGLALAAGTAAAQSQTGGIPDRTLPKPGASIGVDPSDAQDRMNNRKLPTLQDRDNVSDVPPAHRERFQSYCRTRGGCPGGYAQHQGEFAAHEQRQLLEQRREMERQMIRNQRIGVPRTN